MQHIGKIIMSCLLSIYISVPVVINANTFNDNDYKEENYPQDININNSKIEEINEAENTNYQPNKIFQITLNEEETSCEIIMNYASSKAQNITFGVWSDIKGQDDLRWYKATYSNSQYKATADLLDHKTTGKYFVDAYTCINNIPANFIHGTTFNVKNPTIENISYSNLNTYKKTFDVDIDNISCPSGFSELKFAIWTKNRGQDDLKWEICEPKKIGVGKFQVNKTINMIEHNNELGDYCIDVYGKSNNGFNGFIFGKTINLKYNTGEVICQVNQDQTKVNLNLNNSTFPTDWKVWYAVWSKNGNQSDLHWYNAGSTPPYNFNVEILNHKKYGGYYVDAYTQNPSGVKSFICGSTFAISNNTIESMGTSNINLDTKTFNVNLNNIIAPSGLSELKLAVWTAYKGQDDLKWYEVELPIDTKSKFSIQYLIDMKNHNNETGQYYIDVYARSNNGIYGFLKGITPNIVFSYDGYNCELNDTQTIATAKINNLKSDTPISIKYFVWSAKGGQDDLKTYDAIKDSNSNYIAQISIADHKTNGLYYSDAYIKVGSSGYTFFETGKFNVDTPTANAIFADNISIDTGTFRINVCGVNALPGIDYVSVAVWTDTTWQSDLRWYKCKNTQNSNDFYTDVSIKDHKSFYGNYYMDAYVVTNNHTTDFVIGDIAKIRIDDVTIDSTIDENEMNIIGLIKTERLSHNAVLMCAVWSDDGGQDDLKWYNAPYDSDDTFKFYAAISNHKKQGKYFVDVYYPNMGGGKTFLGGTTVNYETAAKVNISVTNIDGKNGTFNINVSESNVPSGITSVQTPTWNKAQDSSEAYKYDAVKEGSIYKSTINVINHKLLFGTYLTNVYLTMGNGVTAFVDDYSEEIIPQDYINITYIENSFYKVVAAGLTDNTITLVEFPTWSDDPSGQDDLIYHKGLCTDANTNSWECIFSINPHKPAGPHITDPCADHNDGRSRKWIGTTLRYDVPEEHFVSGTPLLHGVRNGIDVSEHQGWINWTAVANSWQVGYAIARIGYGWNAVNGKVDDWWETNYANARANGIPLGGYWYSYATNVAEAQAEARTCLSILNGRPMDLPIAFDLEQYPGIDSATNTAMINAFCSIIASAGYTPMVYASESWFNGKFNVHALTGNIYFWVAQWSKEPVVGRQEMVRFWQTSSSGSVSGVSGRVDTNYCYF